MPPPMPPPMPPRLPPAWRLPPETLLPLFSSVSRSDVCLHLTNTMTASPSSSTAEAASAAADEAEAERYSRPEFLRERLERNRILLA